MHLACMSIERIRAGTFANDIFLHFSYFSLTDKLTGSKGPQTPTGVIKNTVAQFTVSHIFHSYSVRGGSLAMT